MMDASFKGGVASFGGDRRHRHIRRLLPFQERPTMKLTASFTLTYVTVATITTTNVASVVGVGL